MDVGVFHRIGEPDVKTFTNSIEEILAWPGLITFDGVYQSVYDHREQLRGREIILFYTGNPRLNGTLSRDDTMVLARYLNAEVGWHTWRHEDLTKLSDEELATELCTDLDLAPMQTLAYPYGNFDERVIHFAKEAGFKRAYSTTQGVKGNDFAIPRQYI